VIVPEMVCGIVLPDSNSECFVHAVMGEDFHQESPE
jgi:hypothetical protein